MPITDRVEMSPPIGTQPIGGIPPIIRTEMRNH
jgi:hypothetical protein